MTPMLEAAQKCLKHVGVVSQFLVVVSRFPAVVSRFFHAFFTVLSRAQSVHAFLISCCVFAVSSFCTLLPQQTAGLLPARKQCTALKCNPRRKRGGSEPTQETGYRTCRVLVYLLSLSDPPSKP